MSPLSGIRLLLSSFFIQALSLTVCGQGPVFAVYFNAGSIKCTPPRGGSHPIEFHNWLFEGDKLSLQDNIAELILFCRDSSYLRLDGKGNYSVLDLEKMPRRHIADSVTLRYLSLLWSDAPRPRPLTPPPPTAKSNIARPPLRPYSSGAPLMISPHNGYITSLDSCIFRWRPVSWAQKYFLRIRSREGEIRFDSVLVDTQAIVNFAGKMPPGAYFWALDLVGEFGRLQFGDSSHIVLIDEAPVIAQLPSLPEDSLGGIVATIRKIAQYEASGCTKSAAEMFRELAAVFPTDSALDKMYHAFLLRNGLQ
jgi:hypothetical protein